jgi:hypothetical protein
MELDDFYASPIFKVFAMKVRNSNNIKDQQDVIQFHEGHHIDALYFFRVPNEYWNLQDGEIFVTLSEKEGTHKCRSLKMS